MKLRNWEIDDGELRVLREVFLTLIFMIFMIFMMNYAVFEGMFN
jgi:hypothetical protein